MRKIAGSNSLLSGR